MKKLIDKNNKEVWVDEKWTEVNLDLVMTFKDLEEYRNNGGVGELPIPDGYTHWFADEVEPKWYAAR